MASPILSIQQDYMPGLIHMVMSSITCGATWPGLRYSSGLDGPSPLTVSTELRRF